MIVKQKEAIQNATEAANETWLPQTVYLHTADDGEQFYNHTNALAAGEKFAKESSLTVLPEKWWK